MADSDRRSTLLDSYENAAVIVSGIAADELGHLTPCPGYDVAALIDHLVEAGHRAAAPGRPGCRSEKPAQGAPAPKTRTPGSAAVVEGHLVAVGVREREGAAERPVGGR
jgi:hypothetical protein